MPHTGELWPGDGELVWQNQANLGKLWHRTRAHFEAQWRVHQDQRGGELHLQPMGTGLALFAPFRRLRGIATSLQTGVDELVDRSGFEPLTSTVQRRQLLCQQVPASAT